MWLEILELLLGIECIVELIVDVDDDDDDVCTRAREREAGATARIINSLPHRAQQPSVRVQVDIDCRMNN